MTTLLTWLKDEIDSLWSRMYSATYDAENPEVDHEELAKGMNLWYKSVGKLTGAYEPEDVTDVFRTKEARNDVFEWNRSVSELMK